MRADLFLSGELLASDGKSDGIPVDSSAAKPFDTIRSDISFDSLCARIYHLKKLLDNRNVQPAD
jgi:hypothetical protein